MESLSTKKARIEKQLFEIATVEAHENEVFDKTFVNDQSDWEMKKEWNRIYAYRKNLQCKAKRSIVVFIKEACKTTNWRELVNGTVFWCYTEAFRKVSQTIC